MSFRSTLASPPSKAIAWVRAASLCNGSYCHCSPRLPLTLSSRSFAVRRRVVTMSITVCAPPSRCYCSNMAQQTWKAFLGAGKGMRGKEKKERKDAVVAAVEAKLGSSFPADVPIGSKTLSFRDDASDAAAIALWGVNEMLGDAVSWTEPVPITAPPLASSTQAGTKRANESQGAAPSAKRVS